MLVLDMTKTRYPEPSQTPKALAYRLQPCGQPVTWKLSSAEKRDFVQCFNPLKQNE